jgi:hypothetical protein
MSDSLTANRAKRLQPLLALVLAVFLSGSLYAQVSAAGSKDPVDQSDLRPVFDFPRPWHPAAVQKGFAAESIEVPPISYTPSISYQFSNERSRVGGISLDSNSAIFDFTVALNNPPFTSIDFSYMFSYERGSSPAPANQGERMYQNVASINIVQPLDRIWDKDWKPAALTTRGDKDYRDVNSQFSVVFGASYGQALSSVFTPNLPTVHGFTHPFAGNALFDYQLAWFNVGFPPADANTTTSRYDRPNIFLECSSGIQLSSLRLGASHQTSSITSSETQLTYQNFCSFTYSFFHRLGVLVAGEWDAPLDSAPVHGSRPDYANVFTFGGGLVYNLYPERRDPGKFWDWHRLSVTLLYSYTAFDPSTETNQVQLQISYSF